MLFAVLFIIVGLRNFIYIIKHVVVKEGVTVPKILIVLQIELPVNMTSVQVHILFHMEVTVHLVLPLLRVEWTCIVDRLSCTRLVVDIVPAVVLLCGSLVRHEPLVHAWIAGSDLLVLYVFFETHLFHMLLFGF